MVNLSDIAQLAQTSPSTVSKVLNNYKGVSQATRERVLAAVDELGYVPNASARQLVTRLSHMVGLLFTETLNVGIEHPFYGGVIEAFRRTMNDHAYDVIFISPRQQGSARSYLDHCRYRNVDGVYVCTFAGKDLELKDLFDSGMPVVTTDVAYQGVPLIVSDDWQAAYDAYYYVYSKGHRRIAHISGPLDTLSGRERLNGFRAAAPDLGQIVPPQLIVEAREYDFESGNAAVSELLKRCNGKLPDAIVAGADIIAIGAMKELARRGIKVPEELSIIGFDNISMSAYINPALTTMAQDRNKLGELTAESLIDVINGKKLPSRTAIPMKLVERGTVIRR